MGFRSPRSNQDAKIERDVSAAARNLGDSVQKIVTAAKAKQQQGSGGGAAGVGDEWKTELLELLGAKPPSSADRKDAKPKSDIDTLLANSSSEMFTLRCVENELPPNLIHCMRLLRVLELQHAAASAASEGDGAPPPEPVSVIAASKVSRLLVALCVDPTVGEQIRPHLFGLLALSGASYPPSGVHVAQAASSVIKAFAENCLTRQLVWFIHDRKMVVHMTDDIKELCGMTSSKHGSPGATPSSPPSVPKGLSGSEAEKAGLWAIALETVVKLVSCSCRFQTTELVGDFESASGYKIYEFALRNSTAPHGRRIVELLPSLAGCPSDATDNIDEKLATNARAFDIQEDLLLSSNPLLMNSYAKRRKAGQRPDLSDIGPLPHLAEKSLAIAISERTADSTDRSASGSYKFDVASALLGATLQLFSDHPDNYEIVEDRQHVLTYYILALPCFDDDDLKHYILKTLEFVLTGVGVTDEVTPVNACVEVFFALCQALLKGEDAMDIPKGKKAKATSLLAADLDLLGRTLEKLLQFDQRVAPVMAESGIMTTSLDSLLDRVREYSAKTYGSDANHPPPTSTPLDDTFCTVCRVLKLLVAHQPVNVSKESNASPEIADPTNLHALLRRSLKDLGNSAAHGAAGVFESYMSSFASLIGLEYDMKFTLRILREFSELPLGDRDPDAFVTVLDRETAIISLIRSVLEARSLARDAFRTCGGFDAVLGVILSFEGLASRSSFPLNRFTQLLQSIISLLDAAVGVKSRNPASSNDSAPLILPVDIAVDSSSSQLSSGSPAAQNRNFMRQRGYYLDLAVAVASTGILKTDAVSNVLDIFLSHLDSALIPTESKNDATTIRNPDAVRLIIGIVNFLPVTETASKLGSTALGTVLALCEEDRSASTLRDMASCGLCFSLTNPEEFGSLLFAREHHLHSQIVTLLSRVASYCMSYMDFVSMIRCLVGPLLAADGSDGRVRLPIISSTFKTSSSAGTSSSSGAADESRLQDSELKDRLDLLCEISRKADRCPRILVGGESINTIAVLMHKVKLEERLRTAAEEGRLRFLEVESIDSSARSDESLPNSGAQSNASTPIGSDKVWAPLLNSGFTYSLWLRHDCGASSDMSGNIYILDISSPSTLTSSAASQDSSFLAVWYDLQNQRFNVMSSVAHRGEPTCFPVSPLIPDVWHHILVTYAPSKRTMMSRKSAFSLFVNGRGLEAEVRVENVNLPPNSRVVIGSPSPALATSGIVRGKIPVWEMGPAIMMSTVLLDLDATAIFACGPEFPGLLWGDRPQRTSLAATGTVAFSLLAESGESGSVASALKRRDVPKLEAAGYSVLGHTDEDTDDLSTLGLLCSIPPECIVFAFQIASTANKLRNESRRSRTLQSERLVNLARLNFNNESVSTDAIIYGKGSVVAPVSFPDSLQWAGGPALLMPLVNSAKTAGTLGCTLEIIREGTLRHPPNLETMQAGGGYRILAVLLKEKGFADTRCLDECLSFAINGFTSSPETNAENFQSIHSHFSDVVESTWVLSDVDAMKHLILNHQVWDLNKAGPEIPLRLLSALSVLVTQKSVHKAFNARRLHLVGIVRWALHLMLEGAELYSNGEKLMKQRELGGESEALESENVEWYSPSPSVADVVVGGDPGNPFLLACKSLLRRVLTFMLTPGDLEALADAIVYTLSITGLNERVKSRDLSPGEDAATHEDKMLPGPAARLYLIRLLEELIVDGVNEIVSHVPSPKREGPLPPLQYHAGGVASPNQPYLSTSVTRGKTEGGGYHPKHQQAQAFLSAFSGFLTPVWFATVLEGCNEEASASAVLRLLILMLQGSASFESAFRAAGGFAPFVMSVPRFSTCPGITLSMLSELLNVPILHLHSFPTLDAEQLCEVFDAECCEFVVRSHDFEEPSSGIFALLAECLGRNIKLMSCSDELAQKARDTNRAVFEVISHRHEHSAGFREFCATPSFLEPLSQALCLVYNEQAFSPRKSKRRSFLSDVPRDLTPTERFIGGPDGDIGGIGMILLIRMVILSTMTRGPRAATVFYSIFRSFPIHATAQQVEAFHLLLIEQCRSVIKEVLDQGDSVSLSNCIGLCSVLLDQQLSALFSAEAIIESVKLSISILNVLTGVETDAARVLGNAEYSILCTEAAHFANLICVAALRISLPLGSNDFGDEDLQAAVLGEMDANIESVLLVPNRDQKTSRRIPTAAGTKPSQNSKLFPVWQSTSLARCVAPQKYTLYPDLTESENPQIAVTAPLLVVLHRLLMGSREDVRSLAISVLVALLQHRQKIMTELLVAEVTMGDHTETIDVVNRGGFRGLLAAHEAATLSDHNSSSSASVKRKYASFFEWFDRNLNQVQLVFDTVNEKGNKFFPGLERVAIPQEVAIEKEQKLMLMRLTAQASENTILGGIERGELARRCAERTSDSHTRWKRQGFDDLAFGATKWKVLLRQLKGSSSVWEGGPRYANAKKLLLEECLTELKNRGGLTRILPSDDGDGTELVKRWKLDLSEGYERQRRRLLPNYEFHGLYNLDEETAESLEASAIDDADSIGPESGRAPEFLVAPQMEATAALLKDLNLKRVERADDDDEYEDADGDDGLTIGTNTTIGSTVDGMSLATPDDETSNIGAKEENEEVDKEDDAKVGPDESDDSSSYGVITGLLQAGDWPEKSYNVRRCTGLEVTTALLLWCKDAIYVIDGFEQTGGAGMDGKITRVEREQSSFYISLRPKDFKVSEEKTAEEVKASFEESSSSLPAKSKKQVARKSGTSGATNDILYQHRSQRIPFSELFSVYRRRYQLQQNALEFYDVNKSGTLIAFSSHKEREEVLSKVLQAKLPNSIFSSSYGTFISYSKFMNNLKSKIISQWVSGKMTNFDFIMNLNSFAGRSFNDLTQYPVFPWVIADYESEEIDLDDPRTYRDLSKPMGALGEQRAQQFLERYEALASTCFSDDDPPPFMYGAHYSCAAYVLYYLMRLEPFSRLALALQGGRFDVADRLFHDVGRSWNSASSENLQDVRELIPEFFYLPDFLRNTNHFDFGETQRGKTVHDVSLPKWAKGDPQRFVRINRQALESDYVSRNLHHWVDLIFGYKQRGQEAVDALNVFVHVTYEGEVDLETMTDPVQRASTIAQIQNFGQTPSRLERKPFPQRQVLHPLKDNAIDFGSLQSLAPLTPPFCIVGAPHRVAVRSTTTDTCKLGTAGQSDGSVGDMCLVKGQLIGVGRMCALIVSAKKFYRFGLVNNGVSIHAASGYRDAKKALSFHDALHRSPITAAKASLNGDWLVTGCVDSTLRVWRYDGNTLNLRSTLCGHDGSHIKCIDISTEFGVIASGCGRGKVLLWDLRTLTFTRALPQEAFHEPCISVSINHVNGNIVTLVGSQLTMFDINGNVLARHGPYDSNKPTCAVATDCPEWMEGGIVMVTGHLGGEVCLWGVDNEEKDFIKRAVVQDNPHTSSITALRAVSSQESPDLRTRVFGVDRQDTLLVGDASGKMSICKTVELVNFSPAELNQVVAEMS